MKQIIFTLSLLAALNAHGQSEEKGMPFKPEEHPISKLTATIDNPIADTQVYTFVDEIARPKYDLMLYFARHTRYPYEAKRDRVEGRVMVRFVVNKDGSCSNFEIMRGINPALNEEAIRVLKAMPKWRPAKIKGEPVRMSYTQPLPLS